MVAGTCLCLREIEFSPLGPIESVNSDNKFRDVLPVLSSESLCVTHGENSCGDFKY